MKRGNLVLLIVAAVLFLIAVPLFLFIAVLAAAPSGGSSLEFGPGLGYIAVEGTIVDSRPFIRDLKSLEQNPMVKAILLRIDSPGGVVTPSHEIYSEIVRVRDSGTPVVVSLGTIAASGGYYIACPANLIVANPGTLTGSIGVIMEFPIVDRLLDKVGIGVEVIKSREHKDIGSPFRRMTPADRELLEDVVLDVYEQFVEIVSQERGLTDEETRRLADGRILTGRQAVAAGLVDTLGTFEDSRRLCADLANLKSPARLIRPRRRPSLRLAELLEVTAERILGLPRSPRLSFLWP